MAHVLCAERRILENLYDQRGIIRTPILHDCYVNGRTARQPDKSGEGGACGLVILAWTVGSDAMKLETVIQALWAELPPLCWRRWRDPGRPVRCMRQRCCTACLGPFISSVLTCY